MALRGCGGDVGVYWAVMAWFLHALMESLILAQDERWRRA